MKRYVVLVLAVLVLAACGVASTPTPDSTSTQVPQARAVIASPRPTQRRTASILPTGTPVPTQVATETETPSPEPTETVTPTTTPTPGPRRVAAQVLNVVSGTTIEVLLEGEVQAVEYWGIEGPDYYESQYSQIQAVNQELVEGETVYLEVVEPVPAAARRLQAYAFLSDGTFVNVELVRRGYATACCRSPSCSYESLFLQAQQEAIDARSGLWSSVSVASLEAPCLQLQVPSATLEIGQVLPITMTLSNPRTNCRSYGCASLSLDMKPGNLMTIPLEPKRCTSVRPGQTHQVQLLLHAVRTGELVITGRAGYEMRTTEPYHDIWFWTGCASQSIGITITQGAGRILFRSDNVSRPGYWVMDPHGGSRTYLGSEPEIEEYFGFLREQERTSPDGQQRVFEGRADNAVEVFILAHPGPELVDPVPQQLTTLGSLSYDPVWSPGGERIVFVSQANEGDDIWLVNADGSGAMWLTRNLWEWDKHPSWSPDGDRIVFWSNRSGLMQIYVMDADGSNLRNISNTEWDEYDPIWLK